MSDTDGQSSTWHWHEYRVGLASEVARACVRSFTAFLAGLGGAFLLILGGGLLAEEDLLGNPGLEEAIDHLSRLSVGVLMAFALIVMGVCAVAAFVQEVTTSRALVRAAARGASRHAVPSPDQVQSVITEPATLLRYFGWVNAVLAGLVGLIGLIVVLTGNDSEGWPIALIAFGYALVMSLVGFASQRWLPLAHERRRARIAAHWTAKDEAQAWKRAKSVDRGGAGKKTAPGSSKAASYIYGAGTLCVLGFVALQASLAMRCRGGKYQCDEVYYSSMIELVLSWGFWLFVATLPLAALLAMIGVLLDWRQRRSERVDLLAMLADSRSGYPNKGLLTYHVRRRTHPLARVGAAMSGAGLVFSTSSYMLGHGVGLGSYEIFAVYRTEALTAMLISAGLFVATAVGTGIANVRGREFRNALLERWPTQPSLPVGKDGKAKQPRQRLTLQGPHSVKVGADE